MKYEYAVVDVRQVGHADALAAQLADLGEREFELKAQVNIGAGRYLIFQRPVLIKQRRVPLEEYATAQR